MLVLVFHFTQVFKGLTETCKRSQDSSNLPHQWLRLLWVVTICDHLTLQAGWPEKTKEGCLTKGLLWHSNPGVSPACCSKAPGLGNALFSRMRSGPVWRAWDGCIHLTAVDLRAECTWPETLSAQSDFDVTSRKGLEFLLSSMFWWGLLLFRAQGRWMKKKIDDSDSASWKPHDSIEEILNSKGNRLKDSHV